MSKDVEAKKMEKKPAAIGKKAEIDDQKKQVGQSKKGDKEFMKLQVEMDKQLKRNQDALNKDTVQAQEAATKRISKMLATQARKQYAAKRKKYEEDLDRLRNKADVELAILHATILEEACSSSSASQIQFPAESKDKISNLKPPVRLSQEEVSEGLADFGEVQRLIFQRLGDRLLLKPRKYLSPFVIRKSRPDVPLAKAIALRRKIAADDELKRYARALCFSLVIYFLYSTIISLHI